MIEKRGGKLLADLTTIDGHQIIFDGAGVSAVADRGEATGAAVTCVYGITARMVRTREVAAGFLDRSWSDGEIRQADQT